MTPEEIREYNKIVIDVSEKMVKPWKWSTIILSVLLAGMVCLYFFKLTVVEVEQNFDGSNSIGTVNNQKG